MAGVVTTRLLEALAEIGVDVSKKQPSNVKTLATKNKSSATKPGLLAGERDTGGNFGTVLDIFKKEAQYIDGMNDVEQMAFLNNIMDYKEFGGKSIKVSEGMKLKDEFDKGLGTLKDDIESLQSTAKTMKDDAKKGLASAEKDLKDFIDTGGQPLKAKSDKYLGGSMHEEGQLRTAIRTFLRNEYKNGRIKLDKDDQFRIMEYSPMMEDDPIKVFKKIYGDEAYNKAGTFPGAFEIGENFNHYEKIFKENMGEDLLKVKDKKYVGDGKLILTKQEEVVTPTPDEDTPFAKGGRASFVGGKVVDELVAMIVKKEPMDAMKEVNKIIGKKGKYKNLTQKDIDRIVDQTNDHIFQRDPDNLYVGDRDINKSVDDMSIEDSLTTLEGLGATKMAERFKLKQKYPGLDDDLLTNIIEDTDPVHKASVLAKIDMAMELGKTNKSADEIIDILKKEPETKMATGGRAGFGEGGMGQLELPFGEPLFTMKMNGKLFGIYKQSNGNHLSVPLGSDGKPNYAKGGRAGYYGGGQAMIEPDLSDIGHGSDALMARTRMTAPGSQATTSTGLNYLLGEDNDNVRVPFKDGKTYKQKLEEEIKKRLKYKRQGMEFDKPLGPDGTFHSQNPPMRYEVASGGRIPFNKGLLVPPKKPYTEEMFQDDSMTLLKGMYGTGKDSNEFLYNEMIKKGNKLRERGVERETVIEIIRNNKDKIDMILKQQTTSPKSLAGLADGGRIGFAGGGKDASTTSYSKSFDKQHGTNTVSRANKTVDAQQSGEADDRSNFEQNVNHREAMRNYQKPPESKLKNVANTAQEANYLYNIYKANPQGLALSIFGKKYGQPIIEKFGKPLIDKLKNLRSEVDIEEDGIMQMAELNDMQKKMLSGPQKQLKDIMGISNEEILQNISPFNTEETPATIEDVNKFYAAEGGVAGLRQGYAGGTLVDKGRRGFLKFLGGTAAGVVALKAGLVKMLGKESGAISKKAIDEVIIEGGSGAPAWLQPLVNKALREGKDISQNAIKDGQVVKSLDTPTGKVDVYYDARTGEIDIDYIGGNTALGESVNMRYIPGVADEGTKGVKPADEFEASEAIPEGRMTGPDDYSVELGENTVSEVKDLYSDVSELQALGGDKRLINDISVTLQKKKVLKKMNENPTEFANDNLPDYDY